MGAILRPLYLLLCLGLAACGTPAEVRDYAKMTDTHIANMNDQLASFGRLETGIMQSRRSTALRMNALAISAERSLAQRLDQVGTKSGACLDAREKCIKVYELILAQYAKQQEDAAKAEATEAAFGKALDAKIVSVPEKIAPLKTNLELGEKAASALSQELSKKEQAQFLFRYAKVAKKTYDDSRKQAEDETEKEGKAN